MDDVNHLLSELLTAHGLAVTLREERLVVAPDTPPLAGRVVHHNHRDDHHSVQLDVILDLPYGRSLIESFAGWGGSRDQALRVALQNFSLNSLHVLMAAFYGGGASHIETETWTIHGRPWRAFLGPFGTTQAGPEPAQLPDGLIPLLDSFLTADPLSPVPHWLRMFYAQPGEADPVCEVLLDNTPWTDAQRKVAALPWDEGEDYHSVRNFTVLLPGE